VQYVKMARETHAGRDMQRECARGRRTTKHGGGARARRGGVVRGVRDAERKCVSPRGTRYIRAEGP
jgi:hypothetical protein